MITVNLHAPRQRSLHTNQRFLTKPRLDFRPPVAPKPRAAVPAQNKVSLTTTEHPVAISINTKRNLDIVCRRRRKFERHVEETKIVTDRQHLRHIKTHIRRSFCIGKIGRRQGLCTK